MINIISYLHNLTNLKHKLQVIIQVISGIMFNIERFAHIISHIISILH